MLSRAFYGLLSSSGSFAMFAAMRRASSRVRSYRGGRRPTKGRSSSHFGPVAQCTWSI